MAKKEKENAGTPAAKTGRTDKTRAGKASPTAGGDDSSSALPETRINVADIQVLRVLIEEQGRRQLVEVQRLLQQEREQWAAQANVPVPPSPYDDNAMGRLLATTSEIRERGARQEAALAEIQRRVGLLEENHRPPATNPDRDGLVRVGAIRWLVANFCKAVNLLRPTPAIIGRIMHDERVFDRSAAKSPFMIFNSIYTTVRREFGLHSPPSDSSGTQIDHVHLTDDMVALMEGRSSRPRKKHAAYYDSVLKPRLALLIHSGLATFDENHHGQRTNYDRYLTAQGREVFADWPEWTDRTGGIGLADTQHPPPAPPVGAESTQPPLEPPT